jgi:hypothetical protein
MWLRAREPNPLIIRFAIADVLQMQSRALHIPKVGLVVDAGKGLFARPSDHSNGVDIASCSPLQMGIFSGSA